MTLSFSQESSSREKEDKIKRREKEKIEALKKEEVFLSTLQLPDKICNFPYCQLYNSCNVSLENLESEQLIIPN